MSETIPTSVTPGPDAAPSGPAPQENADPAQAIDELVRNFLAYRADAKLYPQDHPRVAERISRLHQTLLSLSMRAAEALHLEVRDGVLFCSNFSIRADNAQTQRFISILRQNMVRSMAFLAGLAAPEIATLIQALLAGDTAPLGSRGTRFQLTEHIEITAFKPRFGKGRGDAAEDFEDLGAEAEDDEAAGESKTLQEVLAEGDWQGFAPEQLKAISVVLNTPAVQDRVNEIRVRFGVASGGKDFLPAFFSVLRRDPNTDWKDHVRLCEVMSAGFDLLKQSQEVRASDGALPANLLAPRPGLSDQLSTHLRWRLIRNFFPGAQEERSPREAEDLSFRAAQAETKPAAPPGEASGERAQYRIKTSIEEWRLSEVPPEAWGQTEPETLQAGFATQFERGSLLSEFAATISQLVRYESAEDSKLRTLYRTTLRRFATQGALAKGEVHAIAAQADSIAEGSRLEYEAEVVRAFVAPDEALDYLAGESAALRARLLEQGPAPEDGANASAAAAAAADAAEHARQILRRLIAPRDSYALDVALSILSGGHGQQALRGAWPACVRVLAVNNGAVARWVEANSQRLMQPGAERFLICLPVDPLRKELLAIFTAASKAQIDSLLQNLVSAPSVDATPFLLLGLEQTEPQLRRSVIRALGRHGNDRSLQVLEDQLRRNNDLVYDPNEVEAIVRALASRNDARARVLLERVIKQRKGWCRRWCRGIRRAARSALRARGTESES
ncbi:MAG: HEAT repeat domain-containing protein [Planctomycetes bacterium]|nr:HEAT repeat domain-containing protein [Planctomycetota bacterium]